MSKGICPVCDGTTRVAYDGEERWKKITAGYDANTDTVPCGNCGGQYQWGRATGEVNLNRDGLPCTHEYQGQNVGRCLTEYTCRHCGESHKIDSGD